MSDYSINQIPNIFGAESSQFIKIIQFREIGKRAIVKALRKTNQELEAKNVDFDEIAETSNGSIRTALNKLSLLKLDNSSKKNSQLSEDEDIKLSFFHGLGKFMYNKRIDVTGKFRAMSYEELWDRENRPKLSFDPDEVISKCPCEPSFFWLYLYENFIWFYDDIEDLAEAYETFQTADLFSTSHYTTSNTNSEYIPAQLCGRAVVDSNLHPAKTGFFNFKKPQIFKLHKTIQESTQNLRTLKRKEIIENGFRFDEFLLDVVSFNRNSVLTKRVEEEIQEENTTRY